MTDLTSTVAAPETMRQFILRSNLDHFRTLLSESRDKGASATIRKLLRASQRELALLEAKVLGADRRISPAAHDAETADPPDHAEFLRRFHGAREALLLIDPGPPLPIVDANAAYLALVGRSREASIGMAVFELFPENPDNPLADGVAKFYGSLRIVAETGHAHDMTTFRYDVADRSGRYVERYWRVTNAPVFDEHGALAYLLTEVAEVTSEVLVGGA